MTIIDETHEISDFDEVDFYNNYIDKITCAFKHNVYIDKDGYERCNARRKEERDKYLFKGLKKDHSDNVVLIDCPLDIIPIEFENHSSKNDKIKVDSKTLVDWCNSVYNSALSKNLSACIVSHEGTSPYVYLCNFTNLIEGKEYECKKALLLSLLPAGAEDFVDFSNIGKTLIPVINRPHWKLKKNLGRVHKIIKGINPNLHVNIFPNDLKEKILNTEIQTIPFDTKDFGERDINSIPVTKIFDISKLKLLSNGNYQGAHPIHGSETGMNFTIDTKKNMWGCFRCKAGGKVARAIALTHGIIKKCDEKLTVEQFKDILKIAEDEYNLPKETILLQDLTKMIQTITHYSSVVELVTLLYEQQPIYYDKNKIYWLWNKKSYRWEIVDETDILNCISKNSTYNTIKSKERTEILEAIKQICRNKQPLEPKISWIQFKDKIYDLETNEILQASEKYFISNPIPWKMGENEDTPELDKLLEEWVGKERVLTLKEIMAVCTLTHMPINRIICLIGNGRNGKGIFTKLLIKLLSKENCTATELTRLLSSRFEVVKLYKKLLVEIGEIDRTVFKQTALLKAISGEDTLTGEHKGKTPLDFINYAKPLIKTNVLPETTDETDGFYSRWCIVQFPNQFNEGPSPLCKISDKEFENFCKSIPRLVKNVMSRGGYWKEGDINTRKEVYKEYSNPLDKFIEEFCIHDINSFIIYSEFQDKFIEYLKINGFKLQSTQSIGRNLRLKKYDTKIKTWTDTYGTHNTHIIEGLKFS